MTATCLHFIGEQLEGPDKFSIRSAPVPRPGPGQLLLQVQAVSLGFVDLLLTQGKYQSPPDTPYVPGSEIVGKVEAVGEGVAGMAPGDRVALWHAGGGGAAQMAVVPAAGAVPLPPELPAEDAAALVLDFLTAHYALHDRGGLHPGETVLVLGAAGGVGAAAVQLAQRAGARVIAGASDPVKRAHALQLGAEDTVDTGQPGWRDQLRPLIADGLDLVVDPVGGVLTEPAFRSLGKGGRHLIIGFASGEIARLPVNLTLLKSAALIGVDARHYVDSDPDGARAALGQLVVEATARPFDRTARCIYSLEEACAAFHALGDRGRLGKIIIRP